MSVPFIILLMFVIAGIYYCYFPQSSLTLSSSLSYSLYHFMTYKSSANMAAKWAEAKAEGLPWQQTPIHCCTAALCIREKNERGGGRVQDRRYSNQCIPLACVPGCLAHLRCYKAVEKRRDWFRLCACVCFCEPYCLVHWICLQSHINIIIFDINLFEKKDWP